jgi:hypothetical protein
MADNQKPQRLQVSPEFAGAGLASVLGKAKAAASSETEHADEWVVYGVDTVAQTAAENAARDAGQSLGAWLSALIAQSTAEDG